MKDQGNHQYYSINKKEGFGKYNKVYTNDGGNESKMFCLENNMVNMIKMK